MWTLCWWGVWTAVATGTTPWVTPDAWVPEDRTVLTVHLPRPASASVKVRLASDGIHPSVWQEATALRDPLTGTTDRVQIVVPAGTRAGWYDLEVDIGGERACAPKALAVVAPRCGLQFATFPRHDGPAAAEDLAPLDHGRACAAAGGAEGVVALGLGTAGETLDYLRPTRGDPSLSLPAYDLFLASVRAEAAVDHLHQGSGIPVRGAAMLAAPPPTWPRSPDGLAAGAAVVASEGCPGVSLHTASVDEVLDCATSMPIAGIAWTVDALTPSEALDNALHMVQRTRATGTFATVAEWVGEADQRPRAVLLPLPGPQTDLPHRQLEACGRPDPFQTEAEAERAPPALEWVVGLSGGGGPLDTAVRAGGWSAEAHLDVGLRHRSGAGLAIRGGARSAAGVGAVLASWRVHEGHRGEAFVGGLVGPAGVGAIGSLPTARLPGDRTRLRTALWVSGERGWLAADPVHVGVGLRIAHHADLEAK